MSCCKADHCSVLPSGLYASPKVLCKNADIRTSALPTCCKYVNMYMQCCCSVEFSVASVCIHATRVLSRSCCKSVLSHTCRLPRGSCKCSSRAARPRAELRLPGSLSGCTCGPEQSVVHVHSQCAGHYTRTPQGQNGGMGLTLQPCRPA